MDNPDNEKVIQQAHNHQQCMDHALQSAKAVCMKKGARLTANRLRILELICSSHKAMGAYELLDLFRKHDSKAKPVTVYRALDFLMEMGLVHKVESLNAYIGCLQSETQHQTVILICDRCNNAYELDAASVYQSLFEKSREIQFTPTVLVLELHGLCCSCH